MSDQGNPVEWTAKTKAPDYCRPHGRRIIIFVNAIGGCRKCVDSLVTKFEERAEQRTGHLSGHSENNA